MTDEVILITGANGYIGRHTVTAALACGYRVNALVRDVKTIPDNWKADDRISIFVCDLCLESSGFVSALKGVTTVIHAAASLTGDDAKHMQDTIIGTQTILKEMSSQKNPPHLVLVSSMSVYDMVSVPTNHTVDENTELEQNPEVRDAYCRAKLTQEKLCQGAKLGKLSILRVGAVFGPDRIWNSHIGIAVGPLFIRISNAGQLPLCYIQHAAKALILAHENPPVSGTLRIANVLDTDLPNRSEYIKCLQNGGWSKFIIPLPWRILDVFASFITLVPSLSKRAPGLLRRPVLHARMKPLRYSNSCLRKNLNWSPAFSFEEAMRLSQNINGGFK